jgi:chromosome segregation protein
LKIKGFKSFGKPVVINFNRGLSAIIGPNGTGKSNIVDAVLWVLGEQNPRLLRGHSMQDVIFAGTEKLKPSPYAEVTLVFDNTDGALPFEHSEISIKRIITRDGTSTYYLNERPCRLLDIRDVISHLNLGLELPGIVPQNRVYELINPNSSDLKAIIEEASGVGFYRMRREQAVKRLTSAEDSLEKISILKEEISRQLKPLKRQAEDYQKIIQLKEELSVLSLQKKMLTLKKLKESFEKNLQEIEFLRSEERSVAEEIDEISNRQALLEKKKEENSALLIQAEKLKKARDSLSNLEFLMMLVEEKGKHYLERLSGLSNQISFLKVSIQEEAQRLNQLKEELSSIEKKRYEAQKNKELHESQMKAVSEDLKKLSREQSLLEKQFSELKNLMEKTSRDIFELESRKKNLEELEHRYQNESESYMIAAGETEKSLSELKKEIESLEKKRDAFEKEVEGLDKRLNAQVSVYQEKTENLKSAEFELSRKKKELNEIDAEIKKISSKQRSIFEIVSPQKEIIELLSVFIPLGLPLAYIYEEEIGKSSNLPDCFVVVKRGREREEIISFIESLKKESGTIAFIEGFSHHPAGFYYRTSSSANFYKLIARREELAEEIGRINRDIEKHREEVDEAERTSAHLRNQIEELKVKLSEIISLLHKKTGETRVMEERMSFYLSEIEKRKLERERIKAELSELVKNATDEYSRLEKLKEEMIFREKNLEAIRKEIREMNERLNGYRNRLRAYEDDLRRIQFRMDEITREISRLERSIGENRNNLSRLNESSEAVEYIIGRVNEVHRLISSITETGSIIFATAGESERLENFLNTYNREMAELLEKLRGLYDRRSRLAARKEILENQLNEVEKKIAELVEEIENETQKPIDEVIKSIEINLKEDEIDDRIQKTKKKLDAIGEYNPFALRDYEILKSKLDELNRQSADIRSAIANINVIINEVDRRIESRFLSSVSTLNENLREIFRYLIGGGDAFLEIENTGDEGDLRLNLKIELPGKKLRSVSLLSGGEKSLAALSLILAMERSFNIPFLLLDEVEPALDELNLKRLIKYLREVSGKTQIIMVTHQPLTVENSDVLYGVSIDSDGCSQVYSLKISEEVLNDN